MITQQQATAALGELPEQSSIGELVDKLIGTAVISRDVALTSVLAAERAYYSSPEAQEVYAKFPSSPEVRALKGMAAGLSEADKQKTAKEWEAARIQEKYGV